MVYEVTLISVVRLAAEDSHLYTLPYLITAMSLQIYGLRSQPLQLQYFQENHLSSYKT